MITINDVRYGVNAKLEEQFPNIPIIGEESRESPVEQSFFVKLVSVKQDRESGRRYKRNHSFDIHYYPQIADLADDEMHQLAEQLYDCMEDIEVESNLLRGVNMRHEIIEGVMHFFVDYDFYLMREKQVESKMRTLDQEGFIRG